MVQLVSSKTVIVCFIGMFQAGAKGFYKQFIHNHVSNLMTLDHIYILYIAIHVIIYIYNYKIYIIT